MIVVPELFFFPLCLKLTKTAPIPFLAMNH